MQLLESDLLRIFEATRAIGSTLHLTELLEKVMRLASEVARAEASSLLLMDPAANELYFDIALGEKGEALQQIRLKIGEGIAGWVAQHQKAAIVNDVTQDPRWTQKADKTTKFKTRAILAVPMMVQGNLVGVMEVINRQDGAPFTENDAQLLETFASQAGIAIENARLFESVRQEKEKVSSILREMAEGVVLLEPSGLIAVANPAAHRLLDDAKLQGKPWIGIEETFNVQPSWEDTLSAGVKACRIELSRKAPPPFMLAGIIHPIADDRGKVTGYLIVFSDVTEERREAKLKKDFLSLVSHKLRTPLVSIRGFTPMLLEKPEELSSFQRTAIEAIDRNGHQLTSLVDKLMVFAALEAESMELRRTPQAISSVLDLTLSEMASFLQSSEVELVRDPSLNRLPACSVDKQWIKEVFRNLIENAAKFNAKKPRRIEIAGAVDGAMVRVAFHDNGPGIPPEEREKIFQKFYQIEGSFTGQVQGMGLGLALVRRVIEEHRGSVSVDSTLGQGSTFTVSLPRS